MSATGRAGGTLARSQVARIAARGGSVPVVFGIAFLSMAAWGAGEAKSSDGPTEFARIPGAPNLGWVEVERRNGADGRGWQCGSPVHLYLVSELRRRTPYGLPAETPIDSAVWDRMLRLYLLKRLTEYYPGRGKPGLEGRDRSFSWLTETLERINDDADRAGLRQQAKAAALHAWVVCHISLVEAAQIRDSILASKKEEE